jgi:hypothetical protein
MNPLRFEAEQETSMLFALLLATLSAQVGAPKTSATAQAAQPTVTALQAEITRLGAQLAACRGSHVGISDHAREEAIASLRAVRAALNGGANLETFRKYQVESRIKIDVLPDTKENQIIRDISDLYADALTFAIARITGSISETELESAKKKYADDEYIQKFLSGMQAGDFTSGYPYDMNAAGAEATSHVLMIKAEEKFKNLK